MENDHFELCLQELCVNLTTFIERNGVYESSADFEDHSRRELGEILVSKGFPFLRYDKAYVFPDIVVPPFGVEVKFTKNDSWRCVANSVFESTRAPEVDHVYLLYGKMGGKPEVRWADYGKSIVHVRTSHVPRFEVEIGGENKLFDKMGTEYDHFASLPEDGKMEIIRAYARGRLKEGEKLWWIDNPSEASHSLPLQARLYMSLDQEEKRSLRAEAALLCPKIVSSSRTRGKYNDATLYLLTYHGVVAPQIRDLFSAGSVALRADPTRGDLYIKRSLEDIQEEMKAAAIGLPSELFEEYWGYDVDPPARIREWLKQADQFADGWKPSDSLFLNHTP